MSYDCHDCGRTIESNPRIVGDMAFCDGCWYIRQTEASDNAAAAVSLGWVENLIMVALVVMLFTLAFASL